VGPPPPGSSRTDASPNQKLVAGPSTKSHLGSDVHSPTALGKLLLLWSQGEGSPDRATESSQRTGSEEKLRLGESGTGSPSDGTQNGDRSNAQENMRRTSPGVQSFPAEALPRWGRDQIVKPLMSQVEPFSRQLDELLLSECRRHGLGWEEP
jgi:hypothetical protein